MPAAWGTKTSPWLGCIIATINTEKRHYCNHEREAPCLFNIITLTSMSAEDSADYGTIIIDDWTKLRVAIDAASRGLVALASCAGTGTVVAGRGRGAPKRRISSNLQTAAEKFGKNLRRAMTRMQERCIQEEKRAQALEKENAELLERVVRLRHAVPAPLRRARLRCRASPLVFSAYSISKSRHVAQSGSNHVFGHLPDEDGDQDEDEDDGADEGDEEIENPIKGPGVEKSRYRKKIKHVVLGGVAKAPAPVVAPSSSSSSTPQAPTLL